MKIPDWIKPDAPTPAYRQWKISQQKGLADFADGAFRCVEMTLVVGAVRYLEIWTNSPARVSFYLTAFIAIYVRGRVSQLLNPAIERYDLSETNRRRLYWAFWIVGAAAFVAANWVISTVMPVISAKTN